jgi:hypothetical protein
LPVEDELEPERIRRLVEPRGKSARRSALQISSEPNATKIKASKARLRADGG